MSTHEIVVRTPDGERKLGGGSGPWPLTQAEQIAAKLNEQARRVGWRLTYKVAPVDAANALPTARAPIHVRKLQRGDCAICDDAGWSWAVEGLIDGYVDACEAHVQEVARDTLDEHRIHDAIIAGLRS